MSLLGRAVAVEIGPAGAAGTRIDGLRVEFHVQFRAQKGPPSATIRIYNPAPATIGLLRAPFATIRLFAGYGDLPRLLFQGPPVRDGIDLRTEGADRILVVDAQDGGQAYARTHLAVSFTTATTFGQVLSTVLAQTGWARGAITVPESTQLPHGLVLVGRAAEVLDRLAAAVPPNGADWFLRDNAVYVVPRGSSTPEVAPLLSSTQGNLIGSPNGTGKGLKVRALIDATMRPGRAFVVESRAWNGTWVCRDVTFTGDSGWDGPFWMDLTGVPPGVA